MKENVDRERNSQLICFNPLEVEYESVGSVDGYVR